MISFVAFLAISAQASFTQVRQVGNAVVFELPTRTDSFYVIDSSDSVARDWAESRLVQGTDSTVAITNELAGAAQYFRARVLPTMLSAKPGKSVHFNLALSNAPLGQWSIEGELPEGLSFTSGAFVGTPSAAAAEKHPCGNYTNTVRLTANSQTSSA